MCFAVTAEDPRSADVRDLVATHLAFCREWTAPEQSYAIVPDDFGEGLDVVGVRSGGRLVAMGALRPVDAETVELKTMHTRADARGAGIGRAVLEALIGRARALGFTRVVLETGTMASYLPARTLYESVGFAPTGPFGDYRSHPDNCFYELAV